MNTHPIIKGEESEQENYLRETLSALGVRYLAQGCFGTALKMS